MLGWDAENYYAAVRNTRTLQAYRARWRAARRAGRLGVVLVVVPLIFSVAGSLAAPILGPRHFTPWFVVFFLPGSFVLVAVALALSIWKTQKYLRDHPLSID